MFRIKRNTSTNLLRDTSGKVHQLTVDFNYHFPRGIIIITDPFIVRLNVYLFFQLKGVEKIASIFRLKFS